MASRHRRDGFFSYQRYVGAARLLRLLAVHPQQRQGGVDARDRLHRVHVVDVRGQVGAVGVVELGETVSAEGLLVPVPRRVARWKVAAQLVPAPGNFNVNLPPLFLGHFSPISSRFFPVFSLFPPSCPQDSGNRHQDPEKRSVTAGKRRVKNPKLTLILTGVGT